MKRILYVGYEPEGVDFSDPALPPGLDAEKIHAGVRLAISQMAERGWQGEPCYIPQDRSAIAIVESRLKAASYDCVLIGGGVRLLPSGLELFEALLNAIHRGAPQAAIAFNTTPFDSADAVARWI